MHGVIKTYDTTINGFYVIQFGSEAYTQQNNAQIDGQIISTGELVFKPQYLCSMQENSNQYWKQQSLQHNIIVPTRTILHSCLDVSRIIHFQDIPNTVCNRINEKSHTKKSYLYER